jgi:germination protein YpeB
MRSTYYMLHGNAATFNFAPVENGVTVYPDLVKVTVALDNGEVSGAETSGYLMSHRQRDLPGARLSPEQARASINPRLQVTGGKLALIPVGVNEERLAYEYQGKLGEDNYLIYVNAQNGREENVLKLIDTPGGTLTM